MVYTRSATRSVVSTHGSPVRIGRRTVSLGVTPHLTCTGSPIVSDYGPSGP